eukprot:scaffold5496_cov112-Isochrysis_galbana.AAC.7
MRCAARDRRERDSSYGAGRSRRSRRRAHLGTPRRDDEGLLRRRGAPPPCRHSQRHGRAQSGGEHTGCGGACLWLIYKLRHQ